MSWVARVEPELEEAALPAVELDGVVAADLGPLHDRDPLFLVGEQGEIKVRRAGVGLRVDGQLGEHALPRLGDATVPGQSHSFSGVDTFHGSSFS